MPSLGVRSPCYGVIHGFQFKEVFHPDSAKKKCQNYLCVSVVAVVAKLLLVFVNFFHQTAVHNVSFNEFLSGIIFFKFYATKTISMS